MGSSSEGRLQNFCERGVWRIDFSQVREQEGEGLWAAPRKAGCRTSAKETSKQMRRWLSTRPEKHIALICHHNFLYIDKDRVRVRVRVRVRIFWEPATE